MLAALTLAEGQELTDAHLQELVWERRPVGSPKSSLAVAVHRLRRWLDDHVGEALVIARTANGYCCQLRLAQTDLARFRELAAAGSSLEPAKAWPVWELALALWRAPTLIDLPAGEAPHPLIAQVERERRTVSLDYARAVLLSGRGERALDVLVPLTRQYPFDESAHALLVEVLAAVGRQSDALAAYERIREELADGLGVDPGPHLREAHLRVLRQEMPARVQLQATTPATIGGTTSITCSVPAQLPADVVAFTGRGPQLSQLDATLAEHDVGTAMGVALINGTPGVGKTALAVHWAHRVRRAFPDGQLYANLHGYSEAPPVSPGEVLARFLSALGLSSDQIPSNTEEAAALYRTVLANRRILVVLDNASDSAQIRPLLPGSPSCFVLVTSRDRLAGTTARDGGHPIELQGLDVGEASDLLTRILGEDRRKREPSALARLVVACAGLPLALRIAAANLIGRANHRIADYVAEIDCDRLDALQVNGDEQSGVRRAFDVSYQRLTADHRRLFRTLGLVPGPDFTAEAAAALVEEAPSRVRRMLEQLEDAHLIDQPSRGRFAIHDLLRLYARDATQHQDSAAQRSASYGRLITWQLCRVNEAGRLLYPQVLRLPVVLPQDGTAFSDPQAALDWLEAERANLVAAIVNAATYRQQEAATLLADALRGYFRLRRHTGEWLTVAQIAADTARQKGRQRNLAAALLSLGTAHHVKGDHRQAIDFFVQGLTSSRAGRWQDCEAAILGNLAGVYRELGKLPEAATHLFQALEIYRQTGRQSGRAIHLGNLGLVLWELGRLEEATGHLLDSLAMYDQLGSLSGQANILDVLGGILHARGRFAEAVKHLNRSIALHTEVGDLEGQARALIILAEVHCDAGRLPLARQCLASALPLSQDTGDVSLEATAARVHAHVVLQSGQPARGTDAYIEALRLARDAGGRYLEVRALIGLAASQAKAGHIVEAGMNARNSLALSRDGGFRLLEGQALTLLAEIAGHSHGHSVAFQHATCAIEIHRETGHRPGEAQALLVLADAEENAGDCQAARALRESALGITTDMGLKAQTSTPIAATPEAAR